MFCCKQSVTYWLVIVTLPSAAPVMMSRMLSSLRASPPEKRNSASASCTSISRALSSGSVARARSKSGLQFPVGHRLEDIDLAAAQQR